MEQDERIIGYIKEIAQDLANQDMENPYLSDHKEKIRDELVQSLIKDYGYKDEQAVWSKISEVIHKETNKQWELESDYEKRQTEASKQEPSKKMQGSPEKIPARKRRGHRM